VNKGKGWSTYSGKLGGVFTGLVDELLKLAAGGVVVEELGAGGISSPSFRRCGLCSPSCFALRCARSRQGNRRTSCLWVLGLPSGRVCPSETNDSRNQLDLVKRVDGEDAHEFAIEARIEVIRGAFVGVSGHCTFVSVLRRTVKGFNCVCDAGLCGGHACAKKPCELFVL